MREKGWKYNNAKIYCIKSMHYDKIYINATTSYSLVSVLCKYVNRYKKYKLGEAKYEIVFKLIELGLPHIYELEKYPCLNKLQLNLRLNEHIENNKEKLYIPSEHDDIIDNIKVDKAASVDLDSFFNAFIIDKKYVVVNKKRVIVPKRKCMENKISFSTGDFNVVFD